jgi:hypothetical protein
METVPFSLSGTNILKIRNSKWPPAAILKILNFEPITIEVCAIHYLIGFLGWGIHFSYQFHDWSTNKQVRVKVKVKK